LLGWAKKWISSAPKRYGKAKNSKGKAGTGIVEEMNGIARQRHGEANNCYGTAWIGQ